MSIAAAINVARKYANGGAVDTNPSPAQKEAGNYKMRHITFQGIPITIENPKGTIRSGMDANGKFWSNRMTADYGYIKRTEGKDGDQVDAFVGPNKQSDRVFIIDQLHHYMEKFDEHKCLLGFNTRKQALTAYHGSYGRKYGAHHTVGAVTELSIDAFKEWLKGGGGKEPVAPDVPKFQAGGPVTDTEVEKAEKERERIQAREYTPNEYLASHGIILDESNRDLEDEPIYDPDEFAAARMRNLSPAWSLARSYQKGGAAKATKTKAHYRIGTQKEHCGICTMFQAPDSCTAVMGKIRWMDNCDYFEKKKAKYQEGGAVEDVPGVGPVPTAMPELPDPVKAAAQAYSETPSWLEQATQEAKQSGEAYQRGEGLSGMLADTRSAQELAGGFGGTTIGKVGGIAKAGQEAVHHWSQAIADTLVAKHGNDIEALQNSLNGIHQATSDRAATAILAKLPEDVQHELAVRDLNAAYDRVMRERNMVFEHPLGETPTAPAFREITHPEEARDWLREHGHSPEDMGFQDPESYVVKANELKRREMGFEPPSAAESPQARNWREESRRLQDEWEARGEETYRAVSPGVRREIYGDDIPEPSTMAPYDLDKFFGTASPSEVEHMSTGELYGIRDQLSATPNAYDYQAKNPELWNALHSRLDSIDTLKRSLERLQEFPTPRDTFQSKFEEHLAPLYPGEEPQKQFFNDYFGGMYRPENMESRFGWDGFYFDGSLVDKSGNLLGMITRQFDPSAKTAYHSYLRVNPNVRGSGAVPTMIGNQINLYRRLGIDKVKLNANIDVGSYAWAKYGWLPEQHSWDWLRQKFLSYIDKPDFKMTSSYGKDGLLNILNNPNPKAMWLLADTPATEVGSTIPIGKALLTNRSWTGTLHLNDEDTMARFFEYVARKAKGKTP